MSDNELLDQQWVRESMAEINQAVAECNTHLEPDRPIRLAWSRDNREEQQNAANYQGVFSHVQSGLLQWNDRHCELRMSRSRVAPMLSDRGSVQSTELEIEVCLTRPPIVPIQIDHKALIGLTGPRHITAHLCRSFDSKGNPEEHMVVVSLSTRLSVDESFPSHLTHALNDLAFIQSAILECSAEAAESDNAPATY